MKPKNFQETFTSLTGVSPLPWQTALYERFIKADFPKTVTLPTGLGKTSIIAIWLCALAAKPETTPRRLVYVVNRRTVVDQTTAEVERWRKQISTGELQNVSAALASLCAITLSPDASPLAISTLRGQFADNREWSTDPARPAVIVGTVDMIGSGLLFSRYTVGFKLRPHHAAFLGQDALVIHDEAHLEPAFQNLLERIVAEQNSSADPRRLRAIALTATNRTANSKIASEKPFGLDENPSDKDTSHELVTKRINATKRLSLVALGEGEKLDGKLVALAKEKSSGRAVLVFARSVEIVLKVAAELNKGDGAGKVATLTGTMRGKERDELASRDPVFLRFLPEKDRAQGIEPATGAVFLIATSAGEVGVNLSGCDLVCDLSSYESMAQRFGRVNRFGERDDSTITVVHESEFATAKPLEVARAQTLVLLRKLDGDASPAALDALNRRLSTAEREVAFSPLPEMRTASAIQFDAWALTTIRESIAARPPVAPYLHGEAEWQPPETHVAWRDDRDFKHITEAEAFLEAFPLRPQELLRDTSNRIATNLEKLLKPGADLLEAWVVSEGGVVSRLSLINFNKTVAETLLADAILILPTSVGGLANGLFSPTADGPANDVSGIRRIETDSCDEILENCKLIRSVEISREDADEQRFLLWFETKEAAQAYGVAAKQAHNSQNPDTLATHTRAVEGHARALAAKLLPAPSSGEPDLRRCLIIAATLHDSGKNRAQWQRNLGNRAHLGIPDYDPTQPKSILAKSVPGMRPRNLAEHYRHEFGSLNDTSAVSGFSDLSEIERDIALHLAAAHHGRARPHFPKDEIFDPHPSASPETSIALATEIQSRFARLQRRFGRWGLAWLESLLRAADYAASSGISPQNNPASESEPNVSSDKAPLRPEIRVIDSLATINLRLNPSNPGHYFACCGVFELATALVPDTQAWFENNSSSFNIAAAGLSLDGLLRKVIASDIVALKSEDRPLTPLVINFAGNDSGRCALHLDWWRHEGGSLGKLKPWAGQMSVRDIADDMRETLKRELVLHKTESLKDILFLSSTQNVGEPFYFDANRAINAKAQDVGFSVDKLKKGSQKVTSMATPAVELLCLIGLQRARPLLALNERGKEREYEYHLWYSPLSLPLLAAAASGLLAEPTERYRFANPSRAKDYRAFAPAKLVS